MAIFLEKRKTISTEKGHEFLFQQPIQNIAQLACSKNLFVKVFIFSDSYLFRKVVNTSSGFRFRDQKLSNSHALELLRKVLQDFHLDDKKYA